MGKIRIKTLGNETLEESEKTKSEQKREQKKARSAAVEDVSEQPEPTQEPQPESIANSQEPVVGSQELEAEAETKPKKNKKEKFKKQKSRSTNYTTKVMEVDKNKVYPLPQALELLKKVNLAKFDETVELHINTTEAGISGTVKLPHGTGKTLRIAIATDELIEQIEKGKINFDILIAAPVMMPKLARVAKVLGPKGLMPNPKNGTIAQNPEEAMKNFQGDQVRFRTESKVPVMHLTVGKMSFGSDMLSENIKTIITAIKKDRITQVILKSTMSPAIRISV